MARTSRNTVKKYVNKWNTLSLTYEEFLSKSDAELYALFCIEEIPEEPNPRTEALEAFMPSASKEMARKGMTSHKQWERYRAAHPYLSYLTLERNPNPPHNIAVLNSVTNLAKAVLFINLHEQAYAYLDNDDAGRKAMAELKAACRNRSDQSVHYRPYNDLNDYLKSRRPVKEHKRLYGRKL